MGKETITHLIEFLSPFPEHVQQNALWFTELYMGPVPGKQ